MGGNVRRERPISVWAVGSNVSPGLLRDGSGLQRDAQAGAYCDSHQQLERKIGGMPIDDLAECGLRQIQLFGGGQLTDTEPLRVARNLQRDVAAQDLHCFERALRSQFATLNVQLDE
jgi:hypothetical protein